MTPTRRDSFKIQGSAGKKYLRGTIAVNGAKNAVLPVMAASLLFRDPLTIGNVPDIEDVRRVGELMALLGANVRTSGPQQLTLETSTVFRWDLDPEISKKIRASVMFTGPLLARFGKLTFPPPGGDVIGARPIDIFLKGFEKMGATVMEQSGVYSLTAEGKTLKGAEIFLPVISVTATEAFMMAGVLAKGTTVIKNAALEPEIVHLAELLKQGGAKITGEGTPTITIVGGEYLKAPKEPFQILPDRLETGTFLILGALVAEELTITHCRPDHIEIVIELLKNSGVPITVGKDSITISGNKAKNTSFKSFNVKTHEYPGFPTDLQAPMVLFLTQATGEALVHETIFEGRLSYTQDLVRMGANITMFDPHRVMVKGPTALSGRELEGPDIRAGLAYVIAGLIAKGESEIDNVYYIDRGYAHIEERFAALGAKIKRSGTEIEK